jgi:tetratricopeptide (TPR) repeat protein
MHFALNLDPTSPILLADIGELHYFAGQYDLAIEYCNRALALDPESQMPHFYLFYSYAAKGMENEALRHLAIAESPDHRNDKNTIDGYLKQGLQATLKTRLKEFLDLSDEERAINSRLIAQHYLLLRNDEEAMRWLERIPERPNFFDPYIAVDPIYVPLRSNPRFQAVLHRMRLS